MTTKKDYLSREWHVLYPGRGGETYSSLAQALERASKEGAKARLVKVEADGREGPPMRVLDPEKAPYIDIVKDRQGANMRVHGPLGLFAAGFPAFDARDHDEAAAWLQSVADRSEKSYWKWLKMQLDPYTAEGARNLPAKSRKRMRDFEIMREAHYGAIIAHQRTAVWLRRFQEGRSPLSFEKI